MPTPRTRAQVDAMNRPKPTTKATTPRVRWIQPQAVRSNAKM